MDVVIPFVNGADKKWKSLYEEYSTIKMDDDNRFRDWGFLKYILRGIEQNMPFIENIFILVMNDGQIPEYINRENVHIVQHRDFIPDDYRPCFSPCLIEMFLWNIKDLGEEFIYFNDDMLPWGPMTPENFFVDGKPCAKISLRETSPERSKFLRENSSILAKKVLNITNDNNVYYPSHMPSAYRKSDYKRYYDMGEKSILKRITPFRASYNYCQYYFAICQYLEGKTAKRNLKTKFYRLKPMFIDFICNDIKESDYQMICLNDNESMSNEHINEYISQITEVMEEKYPNKSKYEI